MRQFQCVPTAYGIESEETYFEIYHLSSIMSISFASLKHLNLQNSIKIPVTIWQINYIYIKATVLIAKSDSDTMFCLQSYQGFTFQDMINIQVI